MLPHDVWDRYYDIPCEACEDMIRWRHEDHGSCEVCQRQLCEECLHHGECQVCDDKLDGDNYDPNWRTDDVCVDCLEECKTCNVKFHGGKCKKEHKKTCNSKGRAKRKYESAKVAVTETQQEINATKNKLARLEGELESAKDAKEKARKKLNHLS